MDALVAISNGNAGSKTSLQHRLSGRHNGWKTVAVVVVVIVADVTGCSFHSQSAVFANDTQRQIQGMSVMARSKICEYFPFMFCKSFFSFAADTVLSIY